MNRRGFGSDNHAGVHPKIMAALAGCNELHAPSYGIDDLTRQLDELVKDKFGRSAKSFLMFNGTGANVASLKAMVQSFHSVMVSEDSHLNRDECGAPEALVGCKLLGLPHKNGKIACTTLSSNYLRLGDQHASQVAAISLTQPTELGTCYTISELKEIIAWAKAKNLKIHMDGARFAGAIQHLGCSFKELTEDLGIDVLSFGGTKNGLLFGEMVIFFDETLARQFRFVRKQLLQLPSKTRYMAAQFLAYFQDDLWQEIATHSAEMAKYLSDQLQALTSLRPEFPVETNVVFVKIPKVWIKTLKEVAFFYVWDERDFTCRVMTSWDTSQTEIDQFVAAIQKLEKGQPQ